MNFTERDLENIIYQNAQSKEGQEKLLKHGLCIRGKMYRQVELAGYGRLDLLTISRLYNSIEITVYELKQGKVGVNTLLQACRYLTAIKKIAGSKTRRHITYKVVLIGREVEINGDFTFLYNFLDFVSIITFDVDLDGISFEEQVHSFIRSSSCLSPDNYGLSFQELREIVNLGDNTLPY